MHCRYRAAQILYSYKKGSIPFPKSRYACKTAFVFSAAQYWLLKNPPSQYPQAKYNGDTVFAAVAMPWSHTFDSDAWEPHRKSIGKSNYPAEKTQEKSHRDCCHD